VERLWLRGVSKQKAKIDLWLKDMAPSTNLRQWYGHDPARWPLFRKRYRAELSVSPGSPSPRHSRERGWGEGPAFPAEIPLTPALSPEYGGEGGLSDRL
jgi:hypothetical protein